MSRILQRAAAAAALAVLAMQAQAQQVRAAPGTGAAMPEDPVAGIRAQARQSVHARLDDSVPGSTARRGAQSGGLDAAVAGRTEESLRGDPIGGPEAGPDWWEVHTDGDSLRVRTDPSTGAEVRGRLSPGAALRNAGGCRMAEGRRWCVVLSAEGGLSGWVAGDFLVEGSAPAAESASAGSESRLDLAAGESRSLEGELEPGGSSRYLVSAEAGRRLTAELVRSAPGTHLNVDAPDGRRLFGSRARQGEARFAGAVPKGGEVAVTVYHLGAEPAPYSLRVALE